MLISRRGRNECQRPDWLSRDKPGALFNTNNRTGFGTSHIRFVACFVVVSEYRRHGYGATLLEASEHSLLTKGYGSAQAFARLDLPEVLRFSHSHANAIASQTDSAALLRKQF